MKKNYIYIFLIVILLLTLVIMLKEDSKTFEIDGIKYAVSVNGTNENDFPAKAPYDVVVQCNGADAYWDYENWESIIQNISGNVSCNISFTSKEKVNLNTYIKDELTGTTQGNGQVVNENGYRYEGANPNNYILFNDELWRIIGVFDSSSHGQTGEYLTKIIRNDILAGYAWDKSNVNIWPTSSLYNLLNTYYYNADDGTESGYCHKYSTKVTGDCDYRTGGINDTYRPMVKNVTWYLGGYSSYTVTANNMYTYERSIDDTYYYEDNRSNKTTTGYIGLMYVSDYGYSVLSSSCARTKNISSYSTDACAGNSWLFNTGYEWTIMHSTSNSSDGFYVCTAGNLISNFAYYGYSTRPVLYLDSSVYKLSGEGTKTKPYIIAM